MRSLHRLLTFELAGAGGALGCNQRAVAPHRAGCDMRHARTRKRMSRVCGLVHTRANDARAAEFLPPLSRRTKLAVCDFCRRRFCDFAGVTGATSERAAD